MFELTTVLWLGAHLAATCGVMLLVLWAARLKLEQPVVDWEWRDRAPAMFRLARPIVNMFAHRVADSMGPDLKAVLTARLGAAGLSYSVRPEEFVVTQRLGFFVGILFFSYAYAVLDLRPGVALYALAFCAPVGYFFPRIWLRDAIVRRHRAMEKEFPFFLDVLVLSMRAGLNFSGAIAQTVAKMPPGPTKDEFARVLRDMRTGTSRRDALQDLSSRVDLAAVSNFCAAINQAEDTGGEIGRALVAQASQRRSERFRRAEKLANQAPMKLLLPLVALLFPISLVIILFPLFIRARDSGALQSLW